VKQGDESILSGGNYVVNSSFRIYCKGSLLGKFSLDVEVLNIGKKDVILGLFWLVENGFMVDTQEKCLRNVETGFISKKNKHGFIGHYGSSWHRCLRVSLRCLSSVSWCLLGSSELAVFLLETVLEK